MTRIAFVGNAGSGKTTIANALARNYDLAIESLAAPLKAFAALAYGPIDKAAEYDVAPAWTATPLRLTGRQLLQRLGSEVIRDTLDIDFWVKALDRRLDPRLGYVVDDARFANEVAYLRRAGFMIVRLTGRGAGDAHQSEQLEGLRCDVAIDNNIAPNAIAHDLVIRYDLHRLVQPRRDAPYPNWRSDEVIPHKYVVNSDAHSNLLRGGVHG